MEVCLVRRARDRSIRKTVNRTVNTAVKPRLTTRKANIITEGLYRVLSTVHRQSVGSVRVWDGFTITPCSRGVYSVYGSPATYTATPPLSSFHFSSKLFAKVIKQLNS